MEQSHVGTEIVGRIADREGVDPLALDVPLYEVIDPDALEALTNDTGEQQPKKNLRVAFSYSGYEIAVDGSGRVCIDEQPAEAKNGESGGESTDHPREDCQAERDHRESVLRKASEIMGDSTRLFDEQVEALLEVVREAIGTDYATLSYVDDDTYVFEAVDTPTDVTLQAGETVPLEELPNCQKVVDTEQSLVVKDVEEDAPELVSSWGIASYLGTPVFVDDEVYGTFCFYGTEARAEAFTGWDFTFVEFLGNWVGGELEQRKQERALDAYSLERPIAVD